jgi:NAD(P)H-nitrite reductase large subunit
MKYVIIGGSAAGVTAAEIIKKHDKNLNVTLVSDETFPLYSRCLLTYLIAGSIDESKLYFKNKNFYKENNIKTYLGKRAVSIETKEKIVSLDDGAKIAYDKLLLATGASPKSVDVPGADKKGVFMLRKIDEARAIMEMLDKVKEVIVLGGGLIGLRAAYALRQKQKKVTIVVKSSQVLSRMVDREAAAIIADIFEKNGIGIMTNLAAKEIIGKESVEEVLLDNNERLKCQLVIIGKGVEPNTKLASSCGVKVEEGVIVDDFLRTSNHDIFAAGDVVETYDVALRSRRINALWPCAIEQGEIAGLNMLGEKKVYDGSLSMNSVDFFGLSCISMGVTKPRKEEGYEIVLQVKKNTYKKIVLKRNKIVGTILIGDIKIAGIINVLIRKKIDISSIKHLLLEDKFDYAKLMPLVKKFKEEFKEEEYQNTVITY